MPLEDELELLEELEELEDELEELELLDDDELLEELELDDEELLEELEASVGGGLPPPQATNVRETSTQLPAQIKRDGSIFM